MSTVIDFSASYPSAESINDAGRIGAMLYISPPRESWMNAKRIMNAQVRQYRAAGLRLGFVWQYGGADTLDAMRGAACGKADAEAAKAKMIEIGMPDAPVYFAVDFDISLAQWNQTAVEYFKAAVAVLGRDRVGIYGHSRCVHWAMEDGVVGEVEPGRVLGWVTRSWSNGETGADYAVLYQGTHNVPDPDVVQIDINTVYHAEWGHRAIPTPTVDLTKLPRTDETVWLNKHFTEGRYWNGANRKVEYITRHHMGGIGDTQQCWNWWQSRQASAHYAVDRNGKVGQLVREEDTAWSNADNASNAVSIAIEHSNSAGADQDWPISTHTIDAGARLAAELCAKHRLGRPQFGKNIRDHGESGSTACPYHLRDGGKYHDRWMRAAQAHYDQITTQQPEEDDMFSDTDRLMLAEIRRQLTGSHKTTEFPGWPQLGGNTPVGALALILDQLVGPYKNDDGEFTFGGWPGVAGNGGKTLVEAVAALQVAVKNVQDILSTDTTTQEDANV